MMDYERLIARLKCPKIHSCPMNGEYPSCNICQKTLNQEAVAALTDLLEEIEQLKRERDAVIENLSENLRIAYKQRDAAIKDLEEIMFYGVRNIDTCDYCKNAKCYGRGGINLCDPEWRGVRKEK